MQIAAKKIQHLLGVGILSLSLINCGVLLHPERQGQAKSGKIDPAIAILNGIGLLFYVIPGLVAFAIDFHQGTIYLPNSSANAGTLDGSAKLVKVDGPMTKENIEKALYLELGIVVDLTDSDIQVSELKHWPPRAATLAALQN